MYRTGMNPIHTDKNVIAIEPISNTKIHSITLENAFLLLYNLPHQANSQQ